MGRADPTPPGTPRPVRGGWSLVEYAAVDSTNRVAAALPAWTAVRADTQSAGRGRFQRSWVSDAGGLWLSAVVPLGPDPAEVRTLPLVAGWAVIDALGSLGIAGLRLRWPNDIMAGPLKVAGLLVDGYPPDRAVVGIGVNVTNRPAVQDPSLQSTATRLADLSALPPALPALAEVILGSLRTGVEILFNQGFAALGPRINALWGGPRSVRLDLDGVECTGMFTGVDDSGCLQLVQPGQPARRFAPHEVRLLREI